jgi:hypothetical protein
VLHKKLNSADFWLTDRILQRQARKVIASTQILPPKRLAFGVFSA